MEYWITYNDMNIWKVIQNGNNLKRTGRDHDGGVIILPPTTALLQSIPNDHVADFHYMDDARDIWNAVKARFGGNAESKKMRKSMLKQEFLEFRIGEAEGLHKGYDRMQKILSQLNQLKAKPEDEDINLKFLRALPSSWAQVALTLKTKGGLKLLSFDDSYHKLKTLEVDVKGYTTFSSSHSAFVSATSASKKMSYGDSPSDSSTTTYSAPSNSKTGSHRSSNVIEDVLQSFVVDTEPKQQLTYKDFEQIEKLDLEEMDLKWQMAMLSVRVHKFEQKARRKIDFDKKESAKFNKNKRYPSFKIKEIGKKEEDLKALITVDTLVDWTDHDSERDRVIAAKEFGMIAGCDSEDAIDEGAAKVYNLITGADTEEASTADDAGEFALMGITSETKLDNHLIQTERWRNSSKNLFRLIDSSMTVRTKVGLGFNNCISENELGWDDSAFSVFTTNSEDVEGRPLFNSDKSSEVNKNEFASSDSSVKSSELKPNDCTSCASSSSVSTSKNEAKIESNNENTSRTSCNKNGYFNKKACHFRKHASSVSKLCFVCGSGTHLIKDCDFYEKQLVKKTVGIGVGSVHSWDKLIIKISLSHKLYFLGLARYVVPTDRVVVPTGRTGKVTIPPTRPQPVPTGKPKVFAPVPTGRQNRPFLVPTDRGYSPLVCSGWWKNTARPLPHFSRPTSSYFKTYTSYVPTMSYNHMKYGGDRWSTAVKPLAGCSWKSHRKGKSFLDAEVEGIFDSGCSRSMTGNKERLDDFQVIQGGKVMFRGGEDTECLVLSKDFKIPDDNILVLRVPRKHNLYTINLNNLCPG
nr:hypothetical protein [Tanacetum cinerariifolium]